MDLPEFSEIVETIVNAGHEMETILKRVDEMSEEYSGIIKSRAVLAFMYANELGVKINTGGKGGKLTCSELRNAKEGYYEVEGVIVEMRDKGISIADRTGVVDIFIFDADVIFHQFGEEGITYGTSVFIEGVRVKEFNGRMSKSFSKNTILKKSDGVKVQDISLDVFKCTPEDGSFVSVTGVVLNEDFGGYKGCPIHKCKFEDGMCKKCENTDPVGFIFGGYVLSNGAESIKVRVSPMVSGGLSNLVPDNVLGRFVTVYGKYNGKDKAVELYWMVLLTGPKMVKKSSEYISAPSNDQKIHSEVVKSVEVTEKDIANKIVSMLEKQGELSAIRIIKLFEQDGVEKWVIQSVLQKLIEEGILYKPTQFKYKLVDDGPKGDIAGDSDGGLQEVYNGSISLVVMYEIIPMDSAVKYLTKKYKVPKEVARGEIDRAVKDGKIRFSQGSLSAPQSE